MSDRKTAAQKRILSIIEKYGLMAAANGFNSPPPPPVTVRMVTKDAQSVLLSLPRKVELAVKLGPPYFCEEIQHEPKLYLVDATAKSIGAGVYEVTFFVSFPGEDIPPLDDTTTSPTA